jgi:hypothetical protein
MGRANLGYAGYEWQDSLTKQFENHLSENMNDLINHTLNSLKKSKFRSKFKLSQKDRDYIATKELETIKDHAYQFINSRVAPDTPKNDGKQTPMKGHPVFIAQHGTATCCRKCIQKWHSIRKGRALSEPEVDFIVALIMGWIERQVDEKEGGAFRQ